MQFDSANGLNAAVALNTAAIASSTTTAGNIIDTQGYNSLTFFLNVGARTDGTYTLSIQHGDDSGLTDAATPAADDLVGTAALTAVNTAQTVKKLGYVGNKRYVKVSVVSTSVTSGATVGVLAVRGRPDVGPAA